MPFDFGAPVANMGQTSIAAAEGLERELVSRGGANGGSDSCSGIGQQPYEFSDLVAQFHG